MPENCVTVVALRGRELSSRCFSGSKFSRRLQQKEPMRKITGWLIKPSEGKRGLRQQSHVKKCNGGRYYHVRSIIATNNQRSDRRVESKAHAKQCTRAKKEIQALVDVVYFLASDRLPVEFVRH